MLEINLARIELDIKSGKIVPGRETLFSERHDDGTKKNIPQSKICYEYFGIEVGTKRYIEKGKEKVFIGCFLKEKRIWPAGAGCKSSLGICPVYEKLETLINKYH